MSLLAEGADLSEPEVEARCETGSTDETTLCHCSIHPVYTPSGGHSVGHHSHSRVEASDKDVPESPK